MTIRFALAAGMAAACVLSASAQFRSSTNSVAIYATVADGSGRLSTDLQRGDFKVFDNGKEREITLFSSDPQPITVAIMLDMSGSMEGRFLKVRESTLRFINSLVDGDRAQIGSFGNEVAISPLLTGDKEVLTRVVHEELWPMGSSPLWNAIDVAMTALAREGGRRVILVLTDGADSCQLPRCVRFKDVESRALVEDFMIYAIGMDDLGLGGPIVGLTEKTGGGHFELKPGDDLGLTFARVAEELSHQYLIGFTPEILDGKEHRLEVRLGSPTMRARARQTYVATSRQ